PRALSLRARPSAARRTVSCGPMPSTPDLESLRCFDAVATSLRFRSAAARMHLSPAAFSDRIRRLEETLNVSLLRRSTRSVTLTPAGTSLLPHVRHILAAADRLPSMVQGDLRPPPYELVVGTRYELGLSWLCPALRELE